MSSRAVSKDLQAKIDSELSTSKPKKVKSQDRPAKAAPAKPTSKPASKSGFQDERIYAKVDIPARAVKQLFKAAGLPPSDGTSLSAKVSTFR
jgi:hypothetical protein